MKVTYIGHSGFLVETETVSLLFDYWTGDIPPIPQDKPLYILVSHRHEDHYNPQIFTLPNLPKDTQWLLSYDIEAEGLLMKQRDLCASLADRGILRSLEKEVHYSIDDLEIDTLESTDEGVAFLIHIRREDLLIYHAGDLNWWIWDGESEEDNESYTQWFGAQVERLRERIREIGEYRRLDLAFFTLDPRQEIYESYGMDWQLRHIPVKNVFPMHCSEDYTVIDRFLDEQGVESVEIFPIGEGVDPAPDDSRIRIAHIRKRGECYEV